MRRHLPRSLSGKGLGSSGQARLQRLTPWQAGVTLVITMLLVVLTVGALLSHGQPNIKFLGRPLSSGKAAPRVNPWDPHTRPARSRRRASAGSKRLLAVAPGTPRFCLQQEALLKEKPYLISSMFSSCEGRAELLDLHTPADHPDACAAALQMPKVALMFLTPSDMPHEEFWGLWIRSAAGLVQVDCVALEVCENGRKLGELQKACLLNRRTGAVEQQHLFTLYVHTSPGHTGFKLGSVFRGHELPKHVLTTRNGHTDHTEATRLLLAAALEDPLNQRFILLNEGSIPLYPPTLVYQQLLGEESSRINACDNDANPNRWSPSMEKHVKKRHWRKHDGWFGLIRKHAQAVVEDIHVYNTFRTFCVTGFDKALDRHRDCWPDEHYVPTLLSVMGFEEETDCKGAVITAEWVTENEDAHVRSYVAGDISAGLLKTLRGECSWGTALDSTPHVYSSLPRMINPKWAWPTPHFVPLHQHCPLFARSFPPATAQAVLVLALKQKQGVSNEHLRILAEPAT